MRPDVASADPARLQSFLAFDFGLRRIGVASGTRLLGSAEPRGTLKGGDFDAIAALIKTWQPEALVIGVPRHPDGAPHEMTAKAQNFGRAEQARAAGHADAAQAKVKSKKGLESGLSLIHI